MMAVADFKELHHPMTLNKWFSPDKDRDTAIRMLKAYAILMFSKKDGKKLIEYIDDANNTRTADLIPLLMQWNGVKNYISAKGLGINYDPIEIPDYDFGAEKMTEEEKEFSANIRKRKDREIEKSRHQHHETQEDEQYYDEAENAASLENEYGAGYEEEPATTSHSDIQRSKSRQRR